ncbi:DUF393 domain-containing protein [bacterium SCSIO 12696]|nr:DUF393 domain-containing protein [bacterium SCSIO 12696]
MNSNGHKVTVYYDGACPTCVRDRDSYQKMAGSAADNLHWFDITGREQELRELGIDPDKALTELHIRVDDQILSEIDAYRVLMQKVPRLRPLGWLIGIPGIRQLVSSCYHWQVNRRLRRQGRL